MSASSIPVNSTLPAPTKAIFGPAALMRSSRSPAGGAWRRARAPRRAAAERRRRRGGGSRASRRPPPSRSARSSVCPLPRPWRNPAVKLSPAPVASTASTARALTAAVSPPRLAIAPSEPSLTATVSIRSARAAKRRLGVVGARQLARLRGVRQEHVGLLRAHRQARRPSSRSGPSQGRARSRPPPRGLDETARRALLGARSAGAATRREGARSRRASRRSRRRPSRPAIAPG